jgi:hypothetical protein
MPLTKKGKKIMKNMKKQYGKEKGDRVFYASANKKRIKGVHAEDIDKYTTPEEKEFLKEYDNAYLSTDYQHGFKDGYDLGWKERDERGER